MSSKPAEVATLPPLRGIRRGLELATEAIAAELSHPCGRTPDWSPLQWRLAMAAAAAHGVSPLLCRYPHWQHDEWTPFLLAQHAHVRARQQRIGELLEVMDGRAREAGLSLMPLKGCALHALGVYAAGDRPMADVDLLVDANEVDRVTPLLEGLGYELSYEVWKHRVFRPRDARAVGGLGEHRDAPINIEVHSRVSERLPVELVDITHGLRPAPGVMGLRDYPSLGALMAHLLLHAAGNLCNRTLRLIHVHDLALLSARMSATDWEVCLAIAGEPWWMVPPLLMLDRYYPQALPRAVLVSMQRHCPPLLRHAARGPALTRHSSSDLWLRALPGLPWLRDWRSLGTYAWQRVRPNQEARQERADMLRTQTWLQEQPWVSRGTVRRLLTWATRPVPRADTMYLLQGALQSESDAAWRETTSMASAGR